MLYLSQERYYIDTKMSFIDTHEKRRYYDDDYIDYEDETISPYSHASLYLAFAFIVVYLVVDLFRIWFSTHDRDGIYIQTRSKWAATFWSLSFWIFFAILTYLFIKYQFPCSYAFAAYFPQLGLVITLVVIGSILNTGIHILPITLESDGTPDLVRRS
jgi:hypothetical protein